MKIDEIQNGIVLDHIQSGNGMKIYTILQLEKFDGQVALIQNCKSNKMGKKDVLKIATTNLNFNLDPVAFIDSGVTVNIINDGKKVEKKHLSLPDKIKGFVKCKNPRCITNHEFIESEFVLVDKEQGTYRCIYCETKAGK